MTRRFLILLLLLSCTLTGCSLLPAEPTIRNIPMIQQKEQATYKFAQVARGDLQLEYNIRCEYVSTVSSSLRFSVADIPYEGIYVQKGDAVKKGQLVARLDMQGYDTQLQSYQLDMQRLELEFFALEENRALALERKRLQLAGSPQDQIDSACKEINTQYDRQKQALENQRYILELRIQACQAEVDARQLFAPHDGVVSFATAMESGKVSKANTDVVRIADLATCAFRASTLQWRLFKPGDTLTIQADTYNFTNDYGIQIMFVDLDAVVVSEAQLGLPETVKAEGTPANVYFQPVEPILDQEQFNNYHITLVEDSRENVLYLPRKAIAYTEGQPIVYYLDELGLRCYKPVELGLETMDYIEIRSGLSEGDSVILS